MALPVSPVPATCIRFTVPFPLPTEGDPVSLVLDVPLAKLAQLVSRPVRWMKLVAWGILGCEGDVFDSQQAPLAIDLHMDSLDPGEYTFVRARDAQVYLLNLAHTRTTAQSIPSQKSAAYHCPDPPAGNRDAVLADRDGDRCVFSGTLQPRQAHIIPQSFSHMTNRLQALSVDRGFGIDHHLDPRNTISVLYDLHNEWDRRHGFILATEDRFLRNEDIPLPSGPPRGAPDADWTERPEPRGQATAYVWQMLPDRQHTASVACMLVRHNERARFRNPGSPALPSPAAVNYIYAAGMVLEFLCEENKAEILELLSRSPADSSRPLPEEEPPTDHSEDPQTLPDEMDAFEFLFRLTHDGQFLDYYDNERRAVEVAQARRVDEWRGSLPD